jgi:phenylalanyl-tRNA synthetase beta chain
MTLSAVEEPWSEAFSPWTEAAALRSSMPVLRRADRLRRSLVPSLLGARHTNESLGNSPIELFEIAHVYLPRGGELPREESMVAITSGQDFFAVKGVVEGVLGALGSTGRLDVRPTKQALLDADRAVELHVGVDGRDALLGYLGTVSDEALSQFELRSPATVAELKVSTLAEIADLVPQYRQPPVFPSIARDLNLVVDESVRWSDLSATVLAAAAPFAESLEFRDTFRDESRLGPGKKSLLFTLTLRSPDATLTGEQADEVVKRVIAAAAAKHAAQLRA